jgi:S1-C subfamily serine protease
MHLSFRVHLTLIGRHKMRQVKRWPGASLPIALSLVAASGAASAASRGPDTKRYSFPYFNSDNESWLGVTVRDVNQGKAQQFKLPGVCGAIVTSAVPDRPPQRPAWRRTT